MNKFLLISEYKIGDNKEYEMKAFRDSTIYTKKVNKYLLGLYLVLQKSYLEKQIPENLF